MGSYRVFTRTVLLCVLLTALTGAYAQNSASISNPFQQNSSAELALSAFASATTDPADAVCPRSSSGSAVAAPPELASQNGVLEVTFKFQTTTDQKGLIRYCYITDTGLQSPTLRVNPGDKLIIHFQNDIPAAQASSQQMSGMQMQVTTSTTDSACNAQTMDATSTNMHFHGMNVPPVCHQDEVIHTIVQPTQTFDYTVQIPANEPPGLYWYHPHPHGYSDKQVLGGASGALIVEGIQNFDTALANLPERVLVLRDQDVTNSSTVNGQTVPKTDLSLNYVPVTYGSSTTLPGAVTPATINTPAGEKEFWRVLNASADTILNLQVTINGQAQPLQIYAIDGVPLKDSAGDPAPVTQTSYVLSSASRVEFVVTTPSTGQTAQLVTQTWDNGTDGDADPGRPIANITPVSTSATTSATRQVAQVKKLPVAAKAQKITRFSALDTTTAAKTERKLYFSYEKDFSKFYLTVDGQTPAAFDMNASPNITVRDGTVEEWTIENRSLMDHSFHIHQIHFKTTAINGQSVTDSTLRDTINIPHWSGNTSDPYPSVTLLMDFTDPEIIGTFPYHCHILSHEDRGMMGSLQVLPASTTTTLTASATAVNVGTAVTFTATVTGPAGVGTPTGTVTFKNGATTLGTATLDGNGTATFTTSALPAGTDSVTATYEGSATFDTSTSSAVAINVTQVPTTTALTASATTLTAGSNVTLTASVSASGSPVTSGSVTFFNGTTALGNATLNSSGTATYTTNALPVGSDSITAQYGGSASLAPSTSPAVAITVNAPPAADFSLGVAPTTMSVADGQTGGTTLTVTPANGFSSQVSFSCSGLPAASQCTFSPQTVTPDGTNAITTKLTISTTASSAKLQRQDQHPLLAFLLPGLGAMLGLALPRRKQLSKEMRLFSLLLILFSFTSFLSACGSSTKGTSGSGGSTGTPAGASSITITATSAGSTPISHTGTLALTVTQ
jgi:FtsP/CotA-like multicopper oxidase with cupredoxin domain